MKDKTFSGTAAAILASFIFGALPTFTLNAYDTGLTVLTMQSLKYILVVIILLPYVWVHFSLRSFGWKKLGRMVLCAGILYGAQAGLYAFSIKSIPVSVAAMILFTYPILVGIISTVLGYERLTRKSFLFLLLAFLSLLPIVLSNQENIQPIGILSAFLAAVAYAVYTVMMSRLSAGVPAILTNACANLGPMISLTLLAFVSGQFSMNFARAGYMYIALSAVGGGIIAYALWFVGLQKLGAVRTSALSMTEPMFASLIAFLLLGQSMNWVQIVCSAALLCFVLRFTAYQKRIQTQTSAKEEY